MTGKRTPERNGEISSLGNPDIDVDQVYASLQVSLSMLSEAYSLSRSQAVDCITFMADTMRDGTDDTTTLGARFHWGLNDAADRGENWALRTIRALESWGGGNE